MSVSKVRSGYQVKVRLGSGKWLTKVVPTKTLAKKVETKFKTEAITEEVLGLHRVPTIKTVWDQYLETATKKSLPDDILRWNKYLFRLEPEIELEKDRKKSELVFS